LLDVDSLGRNAFASVGESLIAIRYPIQKNRQPARISDSRWLILTVPVRYAVCVPRGRFLSAFHVVAPDILRLANDWRRGSALRSRRRAVLLGRSRWLAGAVAGDPAPDFATRSMAGVRVTFFAWGMYHAAWFDGMLNLRWYPWYSTAAVILVWWPLTWGRTGRLNRWPGVKTNSSPITWNPERRSRVRANMCFPNRPLWFFWAWIARCRWPDAIARASCRRLRSGGPTPVVPVSWVPHPVSAGYG